MPTLNWIGKEAVVKHHKEVPFRLLEPVPEQFLRDDGAIFISIDDNEVATLRLLMDEIFEARNFVNSLRSRSGIRKIMAACFWRSVNYRRCTRYAMLQFLRRTMIEIPQRPYHWHHETT